MKSFLILVGIFAPFYLIAGAAAGAAKVKQNLEFEFAIDAGDDCTPITLDSPGGSMEPIVRRTPNVQQNGNTCSFHAAGDLYDAWRFREDPSLSYLSSPVELAVRINTQDKMKFINGGTISGNLKEWRDHGSCPRLNYNSATGRDDDEFFINNFTNEFLNLRAELKANPDPSGLVAHLQTSAAHFASSIQNYSIFPFASSAFLEKQLKDDDFLGFMNGIMANQCTDSTRQYVRHRFGLMEIRFPNNNPSTRIKEIDEELNRGLEKAWPLGISFCSAVLGEGKKFTYRSSQAANCDPHAATVIGRRKNSAGVCQYLLRNSWAARTNVYSVDWEKTPGGNDHLWIDREALAIAIHSLTRFTR